MLDSVDSSKKNIHSPNAGAAHRGWRGRIEKLRRRHPQKFFTTKVRPLAKEHPDGGSDKDQTIFSDFKTARQMIALIESVTLLQHKLMIQTRQFKNSCKLILLFIFLQGSFTVVLNSYNMVMFALKVLLDLNVSTMSIFTSLLFYGYPILCVAVEILLTVMAFSGVYQSLEGILSIVNQLNLYVKDGEIRNRLGQMAAHIYSNVQKYSVFGLFSLDGSVIRMVLSVTTTYIIILMQYQAGNELLEDLYRLNMTAPF